ncbi:MAG: DNA primase [Candidatus Melainabacteria bacterium]|nr:DNA primase [Candidatus Melainabacteria bacterium]
MIKNFQELVSQIKTQVPIQELISEFITIKKSGRGYVAICPFHDDHHPSLQIHPQKGIFKCFSCGTGGDLISFYSLINKKKWSEVIPELASKYGLRVEYGNENKVELEIKNQLLELNKSALVFFKKNLFQSCGEDGLNYLKNKRKLTDTTIEKYELGYAQNNWDSLFNHLTKEKKYPHELIIASGLFIPRENQQGYYDRFRNRIVFPIYNESNTVIGFGGRTLSSEDVKYINSPETLIFNKGQTLYGLNFAKEDIKKSDHVILTEGYLDVITAHQHGLLNTVASLGTALTIQQARLLTKYTESKKIYLCLDNDSAGKKAVESIFRTIQEISRHISLDLRVAANLPEKDLDESLKSSDIKTVKGIIANGQKINYFIFDRVIKEYNDASDDLVKKKLLDELLEIIIVIKDPIEQNENIKYIAHRLSIEEELINLKLRGKTKSLKRNIRKHEDSSDKGQDDIFKMHTLERFKHAELELLSLYISSFPLQNDEIKSELGSFEFIDEKHKLIKDYIDNLDNNNISPQELINQLIIEFNEYKHVMSAISDLAWRIESDFTSQSANYSKNKEKLLSEAKNSIDWWVTYKQKMQGLTSLLKDCKNKDEEKEVLSKMINLLKNDSNKSVNYS